MITQPGTRSLRHPNVLALHCFTSQAQHTSSEDKRIEFLGSTRRTGRRDGLGRADVGYLPPEAFEPQKLPLLPQYRPLFEDSIGIFESLKPMISPTTRLGTSSLMLPGSRPQCTVLRAVVA